MDQAQALFFLQWIGAHRTQIGAHRTQLTEFFDLYFGDAAVICNNIGRNYLKSAYRFVINTFNRGYCWHGSFSVRNFLVAGELFMMGIPTLHKTLGFHDLLIDLRALSNALLPYYCEGNQPGNVPALFTDHLHYITTNVPLGIGPSIVFQSRFIRLIYHHFSFSLPDHMYSLFSALATAKNHLGQDDVRAFNILLRQAWNDLLMDQIAVVGQNWPDQAEQNPIFYEIMWWQSRQAGVVPPRRGYTGTPESLYNFRRNNRVHAPEKKGPRGALLGDIQQVPPHGAGRWRWMIITPEGEWGWAWHPAQGQWFWPTVLGDTQWRMTKWPNAAPVLPLLPLSAQDQKMDNPENVGHMVGKEFGMFFAHATAFVLLFLQCGTPEYIDQPHQRYEEAMDS
ncbi:hypothetical protein VPH35_122073 [Triticum aestivum]|uniref:uncharacterized protein isoform X1 n=2 Tax=Triticum aestivum TaxID=4565 RepID=UPI001D028253|nr:uncharacterized protein LOC123149984 isoform X1 [Triticum aestivum]